MQRGWPRITGSEEAELGMQQHQEPDLCVPTHPTRGFSSPVLTWCTVGAGEGCHLPTDKPIAPWALAGWENLAFPKEKRGAEVGRVRTE